MIDCHNPACDEQADGDVFCRWCWRRIPMSIRRRLGMDTARERATDDAVAYLTRTGQAA